MNITDYLKRVAHLAPSEIPEDGAKVYRTNFDNSYLTRVGMEDSLTFLADREITEQLSHGTGFSPKDGKWYGWSHRAIFGFEIGSTCKKGDCHYLPTGREDFLDDMIRFWDEEDHSSTKGWYDRREVMTCGPYNPDEEELKPLPTGEFEEGVYVEWVYADSIPNENLRGTVGGTFHPYPDTFGRGEWAAKTLNDAKQMAIDFNRGVS